MKNTNMRHPNRWIIVLIIIIGVLGCTPKVQDETPQPGETLGEPPAVEEVQVTLTATTAPDLPKIILVVDPMGDSLTAAQTRVALEDLTAQNGQVLEIVEVLSQETITNDVLAVVGVGPGIDLSGLAGNYPMVTFVAVDHAGAQPGANLNVIGDRISEQRHRSFMAGYLAAVISRDYKVAGLVSAESDLAESILDAFMVGAEFYCGVCNPLHPPYNRFPYGSTLSLENAATGFEPVVDGLVNYGAEVLYVQGELVTPELLSYLGELGVIVISDQKPDIARNNWVATVVSDPGPALRELWSDFIVGGTGAQWSASIRLLDMEAGLVSEGRLRLFEGMAADLGAGLVLPQSVP